MAHTLPESSEPSETEMSEKERREAWRQETTAMVFLYVWGSQSSLDAPLEFEEKCDLCEGRGYWESLTTPWGVSPCRKCETTGHTTRRYAYTAEGAPEWLDSNDLDGCDSDDCVTVLTCGTPIPPPGYRAVYSYDAGERDCPECEGRGIFSEEMAEACHGAVKAGDLCPLCADEYDLELVASGEKTPVEVKSGHLYWGEEWQVVVFGPAFSWGSGMVGCLYDNGPNHATSVDDAIEGVLESFNDYFDSLADLTNHDDLNTKADALSGNEPDFDAQWAALEAEAESRAEAEQAALCAALAGRFTSAGEPDLCHPPRPATPGSFSFERPDLAGADYVEISAL